MAVIFACVGETPLRGWGLGRHGGRPSNARLVTRYPLLFCFVSVLHGRDDRAPLFGGMPSVASRFFGMAVIFTCVGETPLRGWGLGRHGGRPSNARLVTRYP